MELCSELTSYCPSGIGDHPGQERTGLWRRLRRWFPFVFPWSPLRRMTGLVVTNAGITLARGRLDGQFFHVDRAVQLTGDDAARDLGKLEVPGWEPVCVCLPRSRTMVRYFRVPADSDSEIESMLPHLLAGELPMSLEHFSWVWSRLPSPGEGFTLVAVHVARNDRLEEFLASLAGADLNIVGLIPEGWSWAHALEQIKGWEDPADESGARSIIIRREDAFHLVAEKSGVLLYEMVLPLAAIKSLEFLEWDGPIFAKARREFEDLLGFPLPQPKLWPDALLSDEDIDEEKFFFAPSVAAAGLGHARLMMPLEMRQRTRRRMALGTLANLGRLAGLAALIWLLFTVYEDGRTSRHLAALESRVQEEALRMEVLEMEYSAIRENSRERAGSTEILQVLASLRRHVKAPINLAHLNYVEGRGVTLRGRAPASSQVLEMTEQLTADPLWGGMRVMQLRSEKFQGANQVHFVVEGQLMSRGMAERRDEKDE